MITDIEYINLINYVQSNGSLVLTRNCFVQSSVDTPAIIFTTTPLVTVRKTAWTTALKEMEWFMSGNPKCPHSLLSWWKDQLAPDGQYHGGYGVQFRRSGEKSKPFDQIKEVLNAVKNHPQSRRIIFTSWNPVDMFNIVKLNNNSNTPTTCHSTLVQLFVRKNKLFMTSYQRSADLLLGVPHNWIQSWALLLWFAHHCQLEVGHLRWLFGDAHIYQHESHLATAIQLVESLKLISPNKKPTFQLKYDPSQDYSAREVPPFKADDFIMEGFIEEPLVKTKPFLII